MFIYIKKFSARSHASFSLSDDKYAHILGLFANFSPKSSPTYCQAYFRNASMLASVMGCPKHSIRIARCLSEIFRPQRWLTRSWMSCVFMMLPSFIFFFVLSGILSRVFLRFVRGSLAPRCLFFFLRPFPRHSMPVLSIMQQLCCIIRCVAHHSIIATEN